MNNLIKHHVKRGNSFWHDKAYEKALSEFREASKIDPDCFEALYGFGAVLNDLMMYEMAI